MLGEFKDLSSLMINSPLKWISSKDFPGQKEHKINLKKKKKENISIVTRWFPKLLEWSKEFIDVDHTHTIVDLHTTSVH